MSLLCLALCSRKSIHISLLLTLVIEYIYVVANCEYLIFIFQEINDPRYSVMIVMEIYANVACKSSLPPVDQVIKL